MNGEMSEFAKQQEKKDLRYAKCGRCAELKEHENSIISCSLNLHF